MFENPKEDVAQSESLNTEGVVFVKDGPTLEEVLNSPHLRDQIIRSQRNEWLTLTAHKSTPTIRVTTEQYALQYLDLYIKRAQEIGEYSGDKDLATLAEGFRENLVFIGGPELNEALTGIAGHLLNYLKEGGSLYLFIGFGVGRSPSYITMRVLEEIERLGQDIADIQGKVRFFMKADHLAKEVVGKKARIVLVDDFSLSGVKMRNSANNIRSHLVKEGFGEQEALEMMEIDLVAMPDYGDASGVPVGYGLREDYFKGFVYYRVPVMPWHSGKYVHHRYAVTGAHCSTDYGFLDVIERLDESMKRHGVELERPILFDIKRSYERRYEHGDFAGFVDPELDQRWQRVKDRYELKPKKPSITTYPLSEARGR